MGSSLRSNKSQTTRPTISTTPNRVQVMHRKHKKRNLAENGNFPDLLIFSWCGASFRCNTFNTLNIVNIFNMVRGFHLQWQRAVGYWLGVGTRCPSPLQTPSQSIHTYFSHLSNILFNKGPKFLTQITINNL